LRDGGFAQKPKHVSSSITSINLIVVDGLYFLFAESSLSYS